MSTRTLPNTSEIIGVVREHGTVEAARVFSMSESTIRRLAHQAGLRFKIGRPRSRALAHRNAEIYRKRQEGMRIVEISAQYGIGVERVRQILADIGGDPQSVTASSISPHRP